MDNQNQTPPPVAPNVPLDDAPPVVKPKRDMTIFFIAGGVIIFLIIIIVFLILGLSLLRRPKSASNTTAPTVTTPPPAPAPPPPPGKFASDSAILKIRDEMKAVKVSIDSMDLFDAQIAPPNLDFSIKINP